MNDTCTQIQPLLSEWLNASLDPAMQREVEAHVRTCASCAAQHALLKLAVTSLQELPLREVSPDFMTRLRAKLPDRRAVRRGLYRRWTAWVAVPSLGVAVVAAALWLTHPQTKPLESSVFVMECVEQHAAYASSQLMSGGTTLADSSDSSASNF